MNSFVLRKMLEPFLIEDIGYGDLTSQAVFPTEEKSEGFFIVKDTGIIAGLSVIQEIYDLLDPSIHVELMCADGDEVERNQVIAKVKGPVVHLLTGERIILNLIQRMSGIATMTRACIVALNDESIHLCDTRKTTPGLRLLEKYAVRVGGGKNHRFGLDDGVMIKDNHIAYCGSITKAVKAVREHTGHMVKIEVETESKEQVLEAVSAAADVIMFDNCAPKKVKQFSEYVPNHIITEASGGITLESLPSYAHSHVNYISLGFLTHSVEALDISMNVK